MAKMTASTAEPRPYFIGILICWDIRISEYLSSVFVKCRSCRFIRGVPEGPRSNGGLRHAVCHKKSTDCESGFSFRPKTNQIKSQQISQKVTRGRKKQIAPTMTDSSPQKSIASPPPVTSSLSPEPDIVYFGEVDEAQESPNSLDPSSNTNGVVDRHTKRELRGAAVAGGLVGLAVSGPILGAVAAGGCALAVTDKGRAGKVARAGGEAVACVGDRLKKIDRKHRIIEKTGTGITKGCNWVANRVKPRDATPNASAPMR